jgi:hypothetical protein
LIAPRVLSIWMLAVVAGVFMGPFDTYSSLVLCQRTLFWAVISATSVVLSTVIRDMREHYLPNASDSLGEVLHVAGFTVLLSPVVYMLSLFYPLEILQGGTAPYVKVLGLVFMVASLFSALRLITAHPELLVASAPASGPAVAFDAFGMQAPTSENASEVAVEAPARLYERLPAGTTGMILHLSARDHFVDVELAGALISLRMRFSDAVAEMDGVAGMITHRSHWVAKEAITGVLREAGKMCLILETGRRVPVRRSAPTRLEDEGILARFNTSV